MECVPPKNSSVRKPRGTVTLVVVHVFFSFLVVPVPVCDDLADATIFADSLVNVDIIVLRKVFSIVHGTGVDRRVGWVHCYERTAVSHRPSVPVCDNLADVTILVVSLFWYFCTSTILIRGTGVDCRVGWVHCC